MRLISLSIVVLAGAVISVGGSIGDGIARLGENYYYHPNHSGFGIALAFIALGLMVLELINVKTLLKSLWESFRLLFCKSPWWPALPDDDKE